MKLVRNNFLATGIFGILSNDDGSFQCQTLEHAYTVSPTGVSVESAYLPKIPVGVYTCIRGKHLLHGMTEPFETFEITGVPAHTGLLFHWGNFNNDSEGCVLLGLKKIGEYEIVESKVTFEAFIEKLKDVNSFVLSVE